MKKKDITNSQHVETTVGELIEAITKIAFEAGQNKEESYTLASLTLQKILTENGKEIPA